MDMTKATVTAFSHVGLGHWLTQYTCSPVASDLCSRRLYTMKGMQVNDEAGKEKKKRKKKKKKKKKGRKKE